jgi:hypothetical protein
MRAACALPRWAWSKSARRLQGALAVRAAGVCLAAACWSGTALAQGPSTRPEFLDLNTLGEAIRAAAGGDPRWRGAWLEVEQGPDATDETPGTFIVTRIVDRARAAEQRRLLERFLRQWLPAGNFRIDPARDHAYPFSELLADLELAIETDPALGGCEVSGGHFAPDPNNTESLRLMLSGRRAKEDQVVDIETLCGRLMRHDPRWFKANAVQKLELAATPVTSELAQIDPSEPDGRWFYADGLRRFWSGEFAEAAHSFHQATLESPRVLKYHYWWILANLQQGKRQIAKRRMALVARRFRQEDFDHQSSDYRIVLRSLERVQGQLRQELDRLERQALFGPSQLGANF